MQFRRHEEFESYQRLRDRRGVDEPHLMSHNDIPGGSMKRSGSVERKDYSWGRNEFRRLRSRSRSPRFGEVNERLNYGDRASSRDEMRKKYDFCDYVDRLDDIDTSLKCNYGDKNRRLSVNDREGIAGYRASVTGLKHDYSPHKSMSNYHEHRNLDLDRFENRRVKYDDSVLLDKKSDMDRFEKPELSSRGAFHFRDSTCPSRDYSGKSLFRESRSSGLKDNFADSREDDMSFPTDIHPGSSRTGMGPFTLNEYDQQPSSETRIALNPVREDLIDYQHDQFFLYKSDDRDDYSARQRLRESEYRDYASEELNRERLLYDRESYDQREMITRDMKKPIRKRIDDPEHSLKDLNRSLQDLSSWQNPIASESQDASRLPYASRRGGRYLDSGSSWLGVERDALRKTEMSNLGILRDNDISQTQVKYHFERVSHSPLIHERMRNSSDHQHNIERREGMRWDHFGPYDPLDRSLKKYDADEEMRHDIRSTMPSEWNENNLDRTHDLRDRDDSYNEYASDRQDNTGRQQLSAGKQGMRLDHFGAYDYDPLDQSLKKHDVNEEMRRHDTRSRTPSERYWNNLDRAYDLTDRDERYNEFSEDIFFTKTSESEVGRYSRAGRRTSGAEASRMSAPEDWSLPDDSSEYVEDYSVERLESGRKKRKDLVEPGRSSRRSDMKHHLSKNVWVRDKDDRAKNVWVRGKDDRAKNVWVRDRDDVNVDVHANDVEKTEDLFGSAKSELPENSEEFKQQVQRFFLSFTKKINENPSTRKRYKEQGRAGSMFCIVCSRSQSKEFIDTQSLLAHCYMSHKFGLRAQHLGLHRAICVLMGWDTETSSGVPKMVPTCEALAQKDDLMIWPPVVIIHNISALHNNSAGKQAINIEALEDFIRGKGFSSGQMKVCLGSPGNTITMVVKFLGTVTGLQIAEKLKKYFTENKRGRADFKKLASAEGKRSNNNRESRAGDGKLDELALYGYMGIAEDLDKVDSDTKRKCSIRSYKEIQDIANDPVKVDQS